MMKLIFKSFVPFLCFVLHFTKIEKIVSLTVQKSCQTPIAHVLVNQNALTFFHAIPNQINKVSMMQPAKQSYLQKRWSRDCTLISLLFKCPQKITSHRLKVLALPTACFFFFLSFSLEVNNVSIFEAKRVPSFKNIITLRRQVDVSKKKITLRLANHGNETENK